MEQQEPIHCIHDEHEEKWRGKMILVCEAIWLNKIIKNFNI